MGKKKSQSYSQAAPVVTPTVDPAIEIARKAAEDKVIAEKEALKPLTAALSATGRRRAGTVTTFGGGYSASAETARKSLLGQ